MTIKHILPFNPDRGCAVYNVTGFPKYIGTYPNSRGFVHKDRYWFKSESLADRFIEWRSAWLKYKHGSMYPYA